MVKKDKLGAMRRAIADETQDWADEVYSEKGTQSEKAKALSNTLTEIGGMDKADKNRLATILSVLTGETVKVKDDKELEYRPLLALTITDVTEKHKHTYEVGKTYLCMDEYGTCVFPDGKNGTPIPPVRSIVRPATKEELEGISDDYLKKFEKSANIRFI